MALKRELRVAFHKPNKHEMYLLNACAKRLQSAENARNIIKQVETRINQLRARKKPVSSAMLERLEYYRNVEMRQMDLYKRDHHTIADFDYEAILHRQQFFEENIANGSIVESESSAKSVEAPL